MSHVKPKNANPIVIASRMVLLVEPWLTYRQVHAKNMTKCNVGTVTVYGPAIREEIGCELRTEKGKETLVVDYPKYVAACKLYHVKPTPLDEIKAKSSAAGRPVREKHAAALAAHEAIHAAASHAKPNDFVGIPVSVGEELTRRVEAAELRCTEANDRVKQLESDLATARMEADEAAQALKILHELASSPFGVIKAILG